MMRWPYRSALRDFFTHSARSTEEGIMRLGILNAVTPADEALQEYLQAMERIIA